MRRQWRSSTTLTLSRACFASAQPVPLPWLTPLRAAHSYESLLDEFWHSHDPTTLNRQARALPHWPLVRRRLLTRTRMPQGPDVGTQYRSAIFYHDEDQKEKAIESMRRVQSELPAPIVTQIVPASTFWEAEEYHQQYLEKRHMSSCGV